jgi:NTE family protein
MVAFVLAGGASLGAIQVGMLRALYERGVVPDVIVGTSAGALNGAYIASRPRLSRLLTPSHRSGVTCGGGRCSPSIR